MDEKEERALRDVYRVAESLHELHFEPCGDCEELGALCDAHSIAERDVLSSLTRALHKVRALDRAKGIPPAAIATEGGA